MKIYYVPGTVLRMRHIIMKKAILKSFESSREKDTEISSHQIAGKCVIKGNAGRKQLGG